MSIVTDTQSHVEKGHVCRFGSLPWKPNPERSQFLEDPGLPGEKSRSIEWHFLHLHKSSLSVPPWMILTKQPIGYQYVNTHNPAISDVLNCNTNVQVGNGSHAFYSTCYLSRSTQAEDRERQTCMNSVIIRLLLKHEKQALLENNEGESKNDNAFVGGLCVML